MRNETKGKLVVAFVVGLFVLLTGIDMYRHRQHQQEIQQLLSIEEQQVTSFRVYPRASLKASGPPVTFNLSEYISHEFFQSLQDIRPYSASHNTVASDEHAWFVELGVENTRIPIGFYIPVEEKNIVVGHLQYGDVQSQKLFT